MNWIKGLSEEGHIMLIVTIALITLIIIFLIAYFIKNKKTTTVNKNQIESNDIKTKKDAINTPIKDIDKINSDLAKLSVINLKKLASNKKINIDNAKTKSELIKKLESLNSIDIMDFIKTTNDKKNIVNPANQVKRLLNVLNLSALKELAEKENIKLLKADTKPVIIAKLKNINFTKVRKLVGEKTTQKNDKK